MDDAEILQHITSLVEEEHAIRSSGAPPDHERLNELEETLDQCWDLLRQRRARRQYGEDADAAQPRSIRTVEGYRQ